MATTTAKAAVDLPTAKANPTETAAHGEAPLQPQTTKEEGAVVSPETASRPAPMAAPKDVERSRPPPAAAGGAAAGTEEKMDDKSEQTVHDAIALLPPCLVMLLDPKYIVAPPVSTPVWPIL